MGHLSYSYMYPNRAGRSLLVVERSINLKELKKTIREQENDIPIAISMKEYIND